MVSHELCLYKMSSSSFGIKVNIFQAIGLLHQFENGPDLSNMVHGTKKPNQPIGKQVFVQLGVVS